MWRRRATASLTGHGSATAGARLVYHVDPDLVGQEVQARWKQLQLDLATRAFLDGCQPSPFRDGMAALLRTVMSRTDANGWTGRGKMFVLSREQFARLVFGCESGQVAEAEERTLLDIGSGDGSITERFSGFFSRVVTTETSAVMARQLRGRDWECFEPPRDELPNESFDVISCLNVLDRADKPLSLLAALRERLRPETGRLLLAVVLPWCPFVEDGTEQRPPTEALDMAGSGCRDGATFEVSLRALVERVISKAGFEVLSVSRVPYISEGDQLSPYYVLSDAILVCKRAAL